MSPEPTPLSEQGRAVKAVVLGSLLGFALALLARRSPVGR
jgi:hypothetical protein